MSKALNLLLIGTILVTQFGNLVAIRPVAYLGMASLLASTFAAGWLIGGGNVADRKSTAITTAVRNVGLCLVIVTSSFPGTPAVTAAVTYGLFQTVVMLGVAAGLGRLAIPRAPVEAGIVAG